MDTNKRPETMECITTKALADAFIAEQIDALRAQIGLLIVGGETAQLVTVQGFTGEVEAVVLDETRDLAPLDVTREGDAVCVDIPAGAVVYLAG